MRLWRVTGTSGAESRLEGGGALTAYVGREREREALEAQWATVKSGVARFVTLRGEPGIGKSRLVDEFRQHVASPDVDVLDMRCTPYSQHSAFLPVTELIDAPARARPVAQRRRTTRTHRQATHGARHHHLRRRAAAGRSALDSDRRAVSAARDLARPAPRAHARDSRQRPSGARRRSVRRSWSRRIFIGPILRRSSCCSSSCRPRRSCRCSGSSPARPEFQPAWPATGAASLIDVSRLDNAEVEAVVCGVAHGKTMPGEVMRELTQRCDGVPLFVEEVTRAVMESGVLEEHEFSWELTGPLPTGLIPASVDASLMARIDRLGDARATAQLAATIGREFSYALLRAVSERGEEALARRSAAHRRCRSRLARPRRAAAETFVFKHVLVQVAAYEVPAAHHAPALSRAHRARAPVRLSE